MVPPDRFNLAFNWVWIELEASRYPRVVAVTELAETNPEASETSTLLAVTVASLDKAIAAEFEICVLVIEPDTIAD